MVMIIPQTNKRLLYYPYE